MAEVKVTKDLENKTVVIEYVTAGSVEQVWRYYAEKDLFEKWWGPEGWETTAKEFDFRVGGKIHYDMHCVDKNQGEWYDQHSWGVMNILEIEEGRSIRFEDAFSDETGEVDSNMPTMQTSVELVDVDGKAKLVTRTVGNSAEEVEQLLKMGMVEGWSSQLEKLDSLIG